MPKPAERRECRNVDCKREAAPRRSVCLECWYRKQPPIVRVEAAQRRLALIPEPFRLARVPDKLWPPGRRWCAGCQTFVLVEDCSGSRCKACSSTAAHASRTRATFGIEPETYQWLLDRQGGRCAICRGRPKTARMAIDHDHKHCKSGCEKCARGLLCSRCNHDLLGAAHDSINILNNAVRYLTTPPMSGEWTRPQWELDEWAAAHPGEEIPPF